MKKSREILQNALKKAIAQPVIDQSGGTPPLSTPVGPCDCELGDCFGGGNGWHLDDEECRIHYNEKMLECNQCADPVKKRNCKSYQAMAFKACKTAGRSCRIKEDECNAGGSSKGVVCRCFVDSCTWNSLWSGGGCLSDDEYEAIRIRIRDNANNNRTACSEAINRCEQRSKPSMQNVEIDVDV